MEKKKVRGATFPVTLSMWCYLYSELMFSWRKTSHVMSIVLPPHSQRASGVCVCLEASEDNSRHFKLPHWGQIFSEDSRVMLESRKILAQASVSALSTKRLISCIPFCLCADLHRAWLQRLCVVGAGRRQADSHLRAVEGVP